MIDREVYDISLRRGKDIFHLKDSISERPDSDYRKKLAQKYGYDLERTPIPSLRAKVKVREAANVPESHLSLFSVRYLNFRRRRLLLKSSMCSAFERNVMQINRLHYTIVNLSLLRYYLHNFTETRHGTSTNMRRR